MMDFPQMILENLEERIAQESLYYFSVKDALRLLQDHLQVVFDESERDAAVAWLQNFIAERESSGTIKGVRIL